MYKNVYEYNSSDTGSLLFKARSSSSLCAHVQTSSEIAILALLTNSYRPDIYQVLSAKLLSPYSFSYLVTIVLH